MNTINNWRELVMNSLTVMSKNIGHIIPNIIGAIVILILGWIITQVTLFILKRILKIIKVDKLTGGEGKNLLGLNKLNISGIILEFVKWVMYLAFLIIASDIAGWKMISVEIGNLLHYLPRLFSAIVLFMIGLYFTNFIKKATEGIFDSFHLSGGKIVSGFVFYFLIILISITALNQSGIDTTIITNNFTIIMATFLASIALSFGLGSKDVMKDLLKAFYVRKTFEVGQKIKLEDISGIIETIDSVTVTVKTEQGRTVIPVKDLLENQVELENE